MKNKNDNEWVFLKNVGLFYEFEMIKSILGEINIPVLKKSRGSDGCIDIIMGMSISGYDIYVPSVKLEEAKEILNQIEVLDELNENIEEATNHKD